MKNSNKQPLISVIVPTYNRSRLLEYTLQSLLLQQMPVSDFEVIVADDGSSDDSREIVAAYERQLQLTYVWQADKGYRPASARNMGIRAASGIVCVFLDSGIIARENCLQEHWHFHQSNGPDVAAVGYIFGLNGDAAAVDNLHQQLDVRQPGSSIEKIAHLEVYQDVREQHYHLHQDNIHDLPAPWFFFWSGHISVSRAHLIHVGLFDESYDGRWGVEDNDLGFRLHQAGIKIHLLRSAQCIHYPHHTHQPDKVAQGLENCRYFHNKFNTPETALFLQHYATTEFVDINLLCLQQLSE